MREKWFTVTVVLLACLGMLTFLFAFTVREDELVVHRRFGKTLHTYNGQKEGETGFYFKLIPPIDRVYKYDQRVRTMQPTRIQRSLADKNTVIAFTYATWRISDAEKLLENAYGDEDTAAESLASAINSATGEVLGTKELGDLVNTDETKLDLDAIEKDILDAVKAKGVAQTNGLDVISLGIAAIRFPQSTTEAVFRRMRAERGTREQQLLSDGERDGRAVVIDAQREASRQLNEAQLIAKQKYAEAERLALDAYKTLTQAPDLANYLRRLEAFRSVASSALANEQPLLFVLTTASSVFSVLGETGDGQEVELPELPEPVGTTTGGEED